MELLFCDKHIVVCVKPSGVLSARDASGKENIQDVLAEQLKVAEVYPVHRLDREVSGVMVYALSGIAAAKLSLAVSDHQNFIKEYIALVEGKPNAVEGVFEDLLFKDSTKNKSFVVKKERRGVKKAKLSYTVLGEREGITAVKVRLYTGRTHQIRVQFASRKMPIVGDRKYGGRASDGGIELYSVRLCFKHPISGEFLEFEKIPEGVQQWF